MFWLDDLTGFPFFSSLYIYLCTNTHYMSWFSFQEFFMTAALRILFNTFYFPSILSTSETLFLPTL